VHELGQRGRVQHDQGQRFGRSLRRHFHWHRPSRGRSHDSPPTLTASSVARARSAARNEISHHRLGRALQLAAELEARRVARVGAQGGEVVALGRRTAARSP
jgi:hypothetical protein